MDLFKKRMKQLGKDVLLFIAIAVVILLLTWGLISIPTHILTVIAWITYGMFGLGLVIGLFYHIWRFINYFFIEPFRRK